MLTATAQTSKQVVATASTVLRAPAIAAVTFRLGQDETATKQRSLHLCATPSSSRNVPAALLSLKRSPFHTSKRSMNDMQPEEKAPAAGSTTIGASADVAASSSSSSQPATTIAPAPLVMQLILSPTLLSGPTAWPRGPLMAQAAHAATACLVTSLAHSANARAYVATPEAVAQMHKVVLKGPEKGEAGREGLRGLSERLRVGRREWEERQREGKGGGEGKEEDEEEEEFPLHYLWIEQPEDVPTCIAVAPNRKPAALKKILNKCSLLRD